MSDTQLTVQERLNLAMSNLEKQRRENEVLRLEKEEIQNQLNSTSQGLVDLIQSNIDLKEQINALINENTEMIEMINAYEKRNKEVELVSEIGVHLTEAVNKIQLLNNTKTERENH